MRCDGRLLLAGGGVELGHSLGALGDGVLGELPGEDQADGRLDLPGAKGLGLGEAADIRGLTSDALEEIADEVAHDDHALGRDARVRVHLLEDLVDVARVRLLGLLLLLVAGLLGRLGGLLGRGLGQFDRVCGRAECPVPLTVRGTQVLVGFAPLAPSVFCAARQNAVLRRSPLRHT